MYAVCKVVTYNGDPGFEKCTLLTKLFSTYNGDPRFEKCTLLAKLLFTMMILGLKVYAACKVVTYYQMLNQVSVPIILLLQLYMMSKILF